MRPAHFFAETAARLRLFRTAEVAGFQAFDFRIAVLLCAQPERIRATPLIFIGKTVRDPQSGTKRYRKGCFGKAELSNIPMSASRMFQAAALLHKTLSLAAALHLASHSRFN
jgi:hypothetical protein